MIQQKITKLGTTVLNMSFQEFYALLDYFSVTNNARDFMVNAILLRPGEVLQPVNDRDWLFKGYGMLMKQSILKQSFDGNLIVSDMSSDSTPESAINPIILGTIVQDIGSFATIWGNVSPTKCVKYLVLNSPKSDAWAFIVHNEAENTVSVTMGYTRTTLSFYTKMRISRMIKPVIEANDDYASGAVDLTFQRVDFNGVEIARTSVSVEGKKMVEFLPKNELLKNTISQGTVDSVFHKVVYSPEAGYNRIEAIMGVI